MIKKILFGLLVAIVLVIGGGYVYYRFVMYKSPLISEKDRASITLMPLPAKLAIKAGKLDISKGLQVDYVNFSDEKIEKSIRRLILRIEQKTGFKIDTTPGAKLRINCLKNAPSEIQQVKEDESYMLKITSNIISLEAQSPFGVLRGLETILQLLYIENGNWYLPLVEIEDIPRFPWRGLMLDVCRHWIPKEVVLRIIDGMATVKMNVFHWHLSDDEGFRVESKVFPKLHEIGSKGKYYTQDEIMEVVAFAAERGIRVVPEFDLPGHSKSWQIAYPELRSGNYPLEFGIRNGLAFAPPIDPTLESTYHFLDLLMAEMAGIFPDSYLHIGGDEVNPKYWKENPSIQEFMIRNNMHDHHDLQAYFNKRMQQILGKHGKLMLGWEEILHPDLGKDIVVQSWRSHKSLFEAVQKGGTAILSAGWYLDLVLPAGKHYEIDPLVLAGAVDIEPDTSYWKMFDLVLDLAGNEMKSQIVIFDRDPENVYGFFSMMESRTGFKNGTLHGSDLQFSFTGPVGEMKYHAQLAGDSINGKISIGLLGFKTKGIKSGGSDMPGTEMPVIEVMKPLTDDEKSRIIGGEACQWAEFVDHENVESRIWPRAAAIAEKLWSPQELTTDVEDMYRRLIVTSEQLTLQGSTHHTHYEAKLRTLIPEDGIAYLKVLLDVLEEVKYHNRMQALLEMDMVYLPDFPLDRVVDAVRPESMEARGFNKAVDSFIDYKRMEARDEIYSQIERWQHNHESLMPFFPVSTKLQDIQKISEELSLVSAATLSIMNKDQADIGNELLLEKLSFLESGENGVIVAVVPGLRRLILEL